MNKLNNYSTDKIFTRLLTNKSEKNYWNYVQELRKRKTEDIYERSILLTKSSSVKERIIGVNVLAQFGFPRLHKREIIHTFFELLKNETSIDVVSAILYAIGHNNEKLTKNQIDLLCSFSGHKSNDIKQGVVFALCTIEKEKAIDTLILLSNDKKTSIRDWATFGLGSQLEIDNEKIRNALWKRISDKDESVRFEAIAGLSQRKDHRIKSVLKKELENIDEYGSLILESIGELNDKDFIPYLEKQIEKNKATKIVNEDWLLDTLNKLKQTE